MKLSRITLPVILAAVAAIPAAAQNHPTVPDEGEVTIINGGKDGQHDTINVYNIFVENAPRDFHVAGAPRFAIRGYEGKFYVGIGGTAKATVSYDWGNPINSSFNFTTADIPFDTKPGDGGKTQMGCQTSNLYVNFVAMPGTKNALGVYMNINFTGDRYGVNLKYAYIKYRGLLAGFNYSLFSDYAAAPATIDYEGPSAYTAVHTAVFDYIYDINSRWQVAAGIEKPRIGALASPTTRIVSQRIPDIPLYAQYSWNNGKGWLRASFLLRTLQYRDLVKEKNVNKLGWGVKLSGVCPMTPFVTAYYQAAYGKGITSYFQDMGNLDMDLTPDPYREGHLSLAESWGAYLALQYNISPKVFATTGYSQLRLYTDGKLPESHYSYAQYAVANVMWRITPEITTGIEYDYGRRVNTDGQSRHDNRLQAMFQVSF